MFELRKAMEARPAMSNHPWSGHSVTMALVETERES